MKGRFPFDLMAKWLSYHGTRELPHREISWSLVGKDDKDIYCRFKEVTGAEDWVAQLGEQTLPYKFDFGAIYNIPVSEHASESENFIIHERELVFDIDSGDYEDLRTCGCEGRQICDKCWQFMSTAVLVIHHILKEAFGFSHFLTVFSGGRGVHLWVVDECARQFKYQRSMAEYTQCKPLVAQEVARAQVMPRSLAKKYLDELISAKLRTDSGQPVLPSELTDQEIATLGQHFPQASSMPLYAVQQLAFDPSFASLARAIEPDSGDILAGALLRIGEAHGYLTTLNGIALYLSQCLPVWFVCDEGATVQAFLNRCFDIALQVFTGDALVGDDAGTMWNRLGAACTALAGDVDKSTAGATTIADHSRDRVGLIATGVQRMLMLYLVQPRIDTNVTIQAGHLLKSPFAIHKRTGNMCLPLTLGPEDAARVVSKSADKARREGHSWDKDVMARLNSIFAIQTFLPQSAPFRLEYLYSMTAGAEMKELAGCSYQVGLTIFSEFVASLQGVPASESN